MLLKMSSLSLPHGFLLVLVVQSSSPTSEGVPTSQNLSSELPYFQNYLLFYPHVFFYSYYMKHSSLTISLNSNNPGLCGQTHCNCNIQWCDNEQKCVPLDYISNILGCYETFQHISLHIVCNPNLCDHIHYMRSNDHEKHYHTFSFVSTLKVSHF